MEIQPATSIEEAPEARPYEPNRFLRWLYQRFFAHIHVDERWSTVVREAARTGIVVYVMRSISVLDFLCLDFLLKRFGLPLVRFVNDLGLGILEPFGRGGRRLRFRSNTPQPVALSRVLSERFSALLFLRSRPKLGTSGRKGEELAVDLIATLVETQRQLDQPILLVPQTFVWTMRTPTLRRSFVDLLLGPIEWPGRVRVFLQFLVNYRNARLRAGEPFDLRAFLAAHPNLTDAEIADKVRYALLRKIERERTLVIGPTKKTSGRIEEELLRSPRVRRLIEAEAQSTNRSIAKVESYARKELRKLCARPSFAVIGILYRLLDWVWNRIYDGIVVDKEGIERIREAARDSAIVLLPSHKSHVDYLVLSHVLYEHSLVPPLIAAGENLAFWPLGPILRRGGAFFIRRSFKGKKLYAGLVDAYMRKLLVEGFTIEFFVEGGRSRTGKLLPPKYGLLSMVCDAAFMLRARKVRFVPVSIGYERIIEERSYVHELSGGEKREENVSDLFRTGNILRSKYGRLYVQFGEILDFNTLLKEAGGTQGPGEEISPRARRAMIQRLAHRVTSQINRVTVVTPAALVASALLVHRRRGMTHGELLRACDRLLQTLERRGARVAHQVRREDGELRQDTVEEAILLFLDARLVVKHDTGDEAIYTIPEERRIALEYYKNNVIEFFVPLALFSAALLATEGDPQSADLLRERFRQLGRLLQYEFMFAADKELDDIFDDALESMLAAGEIDRMADHVRVADGKAGRAVEEYATMLRTYFEAYLLAIRGVSLLFDGPLPRKEWVKRTLAHGQRMYLSGELGLRESLSKPKLDTSIKSLKEHGLIEIAAQDTLQIGEGIAAADLRDLEKKLSAFIR